ncbi:MAG: radical SAM family heme chaperone HemW [Saprospiraceae bacterium]
MSGIYLHIPFCKQACHYCNFHFSTSLRHKEPMVESIVRELELQRDFLDGAPLRSIYLGGGTPSLLDERDLERIFNQIFKIHTVADDAEITLEANPDDMTDDKLRILQASPINRLSIGIQSFTDEDLKFMNRAHNAAEAATCIQRAKDAGFSNLTIDLIYGTPTLTHEQWRTNLQTIFEYDIPHISCYCLTVEPDTALEHFVKKGKAKPVDEEQAADQFEILVEMMRKHGYDHYEISNFAKPDKYALHNSNYWLGEKYLGVGPAAHSFNGASRQWNVANNAQYIKAIAEGNVPCELEHLSREQRYNEYVMTSLRTIWGASLDKVNEYGITFKRHFLMMINPFLDNGTVHREDDHFYLTDKGRLLADNIASELFM